MNSSPLLGVFDSGVGGLSVFREIRKVTEADVLYYGDCANAPYGAKSEEEIRELITKILKHLQERGVTHFVSACNSMSVNTTEELLYYVGISRDSYIDMIDGVKSTEFKDGANVLIIGTEATIRSHVYQDILSKKVISYHTFVPSTLAQAIEEENTKIITENIISVITYARKIHATHILYACTHYPLMSDEFKNISARMGWAGMFIDPAYYVSELVARWNLEGNCRTTYETSLKTHAFKHLTQVVS